MASAKDISAFRRRIGDNTKNSIDTITANGSDRVFELRYRNVFEILIEDENVEQTSGYATDASSGTVTATTAPADGHTLRFTYKFAAYTDAEASELIDDYGQVGAVIEALRELLADASRLSDYAQGRTQVKKSQVFANLSALLDRYEKATLNPDGSIASGSDVSFGQRTNVMFREDTEVGYDLSRADESFLG